MQPKRRNSFSLMTVTLLEVSSDSAAQKYQMSVFLLSWNITINSPITPLYSLVMGSLDDRPVYIFSGAGRVVTCSTLCTGYYTLMEDAFSVSLHCTQSWTKVLSSVNKGPLIKSSVGKSWVVIFTYQKTIHHILISSLKFCRLFLLAKCCYDQLVVIVRGDNNMRIRMALNVSSVVPPGLTHVWRGERALQTFTY